MRRALALFMLGTIAACATLGGYSNHGSVSSFVAPGARVAMHILQPTDAQTAYWDFRSFPFDIFICNASMPSGTPSGLQNAYRPGAKYLASIGAKDLQIRRGGQFYIDMRAHFDTTAGGLMMFDLTDNRMVSMSGESTGTWVPTQRSADSLASIVSLFVYDDPEWDGIYIDECTAVYPNWRMHLVDSLLAIPHQLDWDNDGVADADTSELQTQWQTWRPYLTQKLREVSGTGKVMIANCAGTLDDPELNGITIEGPGTTANPTVAQTISAFRTQKQASPYNFLGIAWATDTTKTDSVYAVMDSVPGVLYGHLRVLDSVSF